MVDAFQAPFQASEILLSKKLFLTSTYLKTILIVEGKTTGLNVSSKLIPASYVFPFASILAS